MKARNTINDLLRLSYPGRGYFLRRQEKLNLFHKVTTTSKNVETFERGERKALAQNKLKDVPQIERYF